MAYIRVRGNQLALVHGAREPGTGKVQQQILFTIYSKPEALALLGRGHRDAERRFRAFFAQKYPGIELDWKKVKRGIAEGISVLPEQYEYGPERLRRRFRQDLCAFAKQLMLTDPQDLSSAAQVITEHHRELEYLAKLIEWRLKLCDHEQNEWTADDQFYWRYALRGWGRDIPPDIEEEAAGFYERGDHDRAEAVFRLLIDCFEGYAEGYNYLGLIALARSDLGAAIAHFEKTIELGRKLFPPRIAKKRFWSDHATRPYMRGLRNLTIALIEAGQFADASKICDRLEAECGDLESASWHRGTIALNTGNWDTVPVGERQINGDATWGFLVAFAEFERGQQSRALATFLRASLSSPRAARMLTDKTMAMKRPETLDDAQDHNAGVSLWRALHAYRAHQSRPAKRFFRDVVRDPRVVRLLDEVIELRRQRSVERGREAFDRLHLMQSPKFAVAQAKAFRDLAADADGELLH